MGQDNADRRLRSAILGNRVVPRGHASWVKAARYLNAAGFSQAAAELFRASQGKPTVGFWTSARLEAFARVSNEASSAVADRVEPLATFELLRGLVKFCTIESVRLVKLGVARPEKLLGLRHAVAALAEAILDMSEPDWRTKLERSDY